MRLEDRAAVVTGASSGLGRAIARRFAAAGARVVVADVREDPIEGGEPTVESIRAAGGSAEFAHTDVSRAEDVDAAVALAVERFGALDVMVNNAAVYAGTDLLDTTAQEWDRIMGVNLRGMFLGCRRAVRQMIRQPVRGEARGRIVNVSSQHGMVWCPDDIAYGTSKAGAVYLTRWVAAQHARDQIVCNAVAPGKILTGRSDAVSPEALTYSKGRTPWPRLGRPGDVASAALFLASDECTYVTGVNLMVDGGWQAA